MTLIKYQSPISLEARFKRDLGRSTKDINLKQPIHNPTHEAVLQAQGRSLPNRVNALVHARQGMSALNRSRAIFPFGMGLGAFGFVEDAAAWPVDRMPIEALSVLENIDWSHPGFAIGMGGTLLAAQIVAMVQRHKILKHLRSVQPDGPQPDLFPETLKVPDQVISPWDIDVATRQGKVRSENQDAVASLSFADGSNVLIVCDGAGGVKGGREASQSAVAAITASLKQQFAQDDALSPDCLKQAIEAARMASKTEGLSGVTTALLVLLQDDQVHWATLGDGDVAIIWPDGMVGHLQVPHHEAGAPSNIINAYVGKDCVVPPRTGCLRVEAGAIVVAMSDGASDLFPYEDVALNRKEIIQISGLADSFLKNIEDARDPDTQAYLHNDNMSLAMARLTAGGDHAE